MISERFHRGANSFRGLLFALISAFLLAPFFQGNVLAEEIISCAYTIILLSTLRTLFHGQRHFSWIASLAAATLLFNIIAYATLYIWIDNISMAFNVAFYFYAVALMFGGVFQSSKVTTNVILGAICIYLLIGVTWGMAYSLLDALLPHSFQMTALDTATLQMDALVQHFIYFSFTTLSTLGYGDITPLSTPARYLSALEAICGQIYLSVLVARLVGMHIVQK